MDQIRRIDATQARAWVTSGDGALVCAYDDEDKCRQMLLDGAMTLADLEATSSTRPESDRIIFYCA